jgi:hypothetical protein
VCPLQVRVSPLSPHLSSYLYYYYIPWGWQKRTNGDCRPPGPVSPGVGREIQCCDDGVCKLCACACACAWALSCVAPPPPFPSLYILERRLGREGAEYFLFAGCARVSHRVQIDGRVHFIYGLLGAYTYLEVDERFGGFEYLFGFRYAYTLG